MADILKETPSAEDIVKKGKNRDKRFKYLAKHMLEKAIAQNALILAQNGLGIAILFENETEENFWTKLKVEIGLVLRVTGFRNALKIIKNQKYVKRQRPKNSNYLYAWFWGIAKDGRGAGTQIAAEMKDDFLRISEEKKLPIYAETRIRKNAIVYQRYRFENYHTWDHPGGDKMWFLRYIPKSLTKQQEG